MNIIVSTFIKLDFRFEFSLSFAFLIAEAVSEKFLPVARWTRL